MFGQGVRVLGERATPRYLMTSVLSRISKDDFDF